MTSTVARLESAGLIKPPKFVSSNIQYEVMMGSVAYGVSNDTSDMDIYGFCIPPKDTIFPPGEIPGFGTQKKRFNQYQKHHVFWEDAHGGKGQEYDLTIYSIVRYFDLVMRNNPNMIDSLFVPHDCVLHCTQIAQMVREKRRMFLHKGAWHTYKGYSFSQAHKLATKRPTGNRKETVEKYGMDCYLEENTEFLTDAGWRKFDAVKDGMALGVLDSGGQVRFQLPTARIDKSYSGYLYTIEPRLTRCTVTPGHKMLVSPCHRGPATHFSSQFFPDRAQWQLEELRSLMVGRRSWYHVRCAAEPRLQEYPVDDWYLQLAGLYLSDGTMTFRNGKVKCACLSQTQNGKMAFFEVADAIIELVSGRRYDYEKETRWTVPRLISKRLYEDFGHGSAKKALPPWTLHLSIRQANLLWDSAVLGDGTRSKDTGCVLYTSNPLLADGFQAMLISAGRACTIRGPYDYGKPFSPGGKLLPPMWQVYVPNEYPPVPVDFKGKSRILRATQERIKRHGYPIKELAVQNVRVVCFEVPSGILVTRCEGKAAFQGNCKYAYHLVRLLNEIEQILTEGDLDLRRNAEQLRSIRRGDWTQERVLDYFSSKERELETLYTESKLPWGPDEAAIKQLLLNCLEAHYGSLSIQLPGAERRALEQISEIVRAVGC